jgi:hypothetical protein
MANEVTFTGLSSAGGRVASVLSALLFEKIHDPTDLRAVMTEVPWQQIGSDTMSVALDGAPGAFAAASSETSGGASNSAYGSGKFDLQIARYLRKYQMSDLFGVTGGPIDANALVQTLADGVGLTMTDLLCALFGSLSTSHDAGTALAVDDVYTGMFTLNLAGAASSAEAPFSLVISPKMMNQFRTSLRAESGALEYVSADILSAKGPGYQGNWSGIDIWQTDSIALVDSSAHFSAAMFAKDAFAYTMAPVRALSGAHIPASNIILDAGELMVEQSRDADNGLTSAVASMFVGVSEAQDSLGLQIKSDV